MSQILRSLMAIESASQTIVSKFVWHFNVVVGYTLIINVHLITTSSQSIIIAFWELIL
jgi:hypothetical protein